MRLANFTPVNSLTAARLCVGAAAAFVVLLAALHLLRPELDPSWRFISEYEIGAFGWLMRLAFLSLAVSYVALFIALRPQLRTLGGYLGLACLLISAAGLTLAAVFRTDPITTSPNAMTTSGQLHSLGGTLGFAMPLASVIISWSLARNPAWFSARRSLLWAAGGNWFSGVHPVLNYPDAQRRPLWPRCGRGLATSIRDIDLLHVADGSGAAGDSSAPGCASLKPGHSKNAVRPI